MFNKFKLNVARKLVSSFLVDVYKQPEKLSKNRKYCEQNYQVAKAFEAIDALKKESQR